MNVILLAPPAAGKGTQAEILKNAYHLAHISTGDLLREATKQEDELGKQIRETIAQGKFVSDDIMYEILKRRLETLNPNEGFILDGFPRNVEQAEEYEHILEDLGLKLGYVFYLEAPKELLEQRITGRRLCKDCGAIYNVNIDEAKPKIIGICNKCGGHLYQREDDNPTSFKTRYETYLEKTQPLIDYYQQKGNLYTIDASHDKEYTFQKIKTILDREMK